MSHSDPAAAQPSPSRRATPSWLALLGWIALAAAAGAVGAIASRDAGEFYGALALLRRRRQT